MANPSIYAAFERMWQHIVLALGGKADKTDIAQSDMSQNDESAPDYVKNRTHWVEENTHVTIYTNNALVVDEDEYIDLELLEPFVVGQEYVITINGTTYNLTARTHSYWEAFMIGSDQWCGVDAEHSDGIDSDVPFGAVWYYDGALSVDFFIATETYDINIGIIRDVYHKLDEGFLPSTIVGKRDSGENAEIFNDYFSNKASGYMSHAEGESNTASGDNSHAEGYANEASGKNSHAEGSFNEAIGDNSHAEGHNNEASGKYSHVEGSTNVASGKNSHAEGQGTKANSDYSHAEGQSTIASSESQHVQGKYNVEDVTNTYAHIVGNGAYKAPSNAHTLDWSGNAWFAGEIKVGGTGQDDAEAKTLATKEYVDSLIGDIEARLAAL